MKRNTFKGLRKPKTSEKCEREAEPNLFLILEDDSVYKVTCLGTQSGARRRNPGATFVRPSKFEDVSMLNAGKVHGTNHDIFWTFGSHRKTSGIPFKNFVYHSKKKEMEQLRLVIVFGNYYRPRDYWGYHHSSAVFNGASGSTVWEANYSGEPVEIFGSFFDKERNCQSEALHPVYTFYGAKGRGYICKVVRTSEFYFLPVEEVETRVEPAVSVEEARKVQKRKEEKQKVQLDRRKKEKKLSKAKRRSSDAKTQHLM